MNTPYSVDDEVIVEVHDWNNTGSFTRKVRGKIVAVITEPHGYDIELDDQISLTGNLPLTRNSPQKYKMQPDGIICKTLYVRSFCVSKPKIGLRDKLMLHLNGLIFKRVNIAYSKPEGRIEYMNVYTPDGKVVKVADEKDIPKLLKGKDPNNRVSYKVQHFYGFTKNDTLFGMPGCPAMDKTGVHFTVNRFHCIDWWSGFAWKEYSTESNPRPVFKPQQGEIVCGKPSQIKSDKPPSFDYWFVCSEQFMELCNQLSSQRKVTPDEVQGILERLIIPKNEENLYISHETPLSRYTYAAIFLLAVMNVNKLPEEWNLPKQQAQGGRMLPFEEWWPMLMMKSKPKTEDNK